MPHPTIRRVATLAGGAVVVVAVALGATVTAGSADTVRSARVVSAGESIQAAIDAARPGDRIVVSDGTYPERLTVNKNGIILVGHNAILVPPMSGAGPNTCTGLAGQGTEVGICVTGHDVALAPFEREHRKVISVGRRVRNVVVKGFEVRGFSGANIALVGATDARMESNHLVDGVAYGAISVGSKGDRLTGNTVTASQLGSIGICADDVAPAVVADNDVSHYGVGLCVQTQGAEFRNNEIHDNCAGVYVDPGIGAHVRNNHVFTNNASCDPMFTGIGIFLDGSNGTDVRGNRIEGHLASAAGAGLILADPTDPANPLPPASDNVVQHNVFNSNGIDIVDTSTGAGNILTHNSCTISSPAELCGTPQARR
jgi:nitrous oxidase accessory protein NosD